MTILKELKHLNLIQPPDFVVSQIQYEVITGSVAYGVSGDVSDMDIYGFCIPHKEIIFPHLGGEIQGFGKHSTRFEQYQAHHIYNPSNKRNYDVTIFSIIKFFQLCMDNNPNMIDSLFVPQRCVLYCSQLGEHVRANRKRFLHAGAYHKFKGYAYSQKNKLKNKIILEIIDFEKPYNLQDKNIIFSQIVEEIEWRNKEKDMLGDMALQIVPLRELFRYKALLQQCKEPTKRKRAILDKGYDVKFGYHIVRLLNEIEQILIEGDIDLERDRERLKSIRNGDWSVGRLEKYFEDKETYLEELYQKTTLPRRPDEAFIKQLLLDCLEMHFGSLDKCVTVLGKEKQALRDIQTILEGVKL